MKTFFLISALIVICFPAISQKNMDDVVYLKNGSKIKGTIVQVYPDSIVQIKQFGGSMWIFPMKDVLMIAKEEKVNVKASIDTFDGYHFGMEAGALIGAGSNEYKAPLGIYMLHSYHITPSLAAGVGAGLEFFRITHAPVYLDLRYYLNKGYYAPFIFMEGGMMIPLGDKETDYDGSSYKGKLGYMINPGIGFLFPLSERSVFSISFSYRYHELVSEKENSPLTDYTRIERMNRFNLRIGFLLR
jgi:hypothetical protein